MTETKSYMCCNAMTATNAARLVKLIGHYSSYVLIGVNDTYRTANNILSLLTFRIKQGDRVSIVAEGPDAKEVVKDIGALLAENSGTEMCLPVLCG
jgi:phosphotransferase system HPr (HPr) family protein